MERISGWAVLWKCLVACLFFDESQQPTWPQDRHIRRCTQRSPVFTQSSQTRVVGSVTRIPSRCVHCVIVPVPPFERFAVPVRQAGGGFVGALEEREQLGFGRLG